jgi:CDP-4-dehydro-6-deoxyglucose reductase
MTERKHMQEYSATVRDIQFITEKDLTLTLDLGQADFNFTPGQFVQFKVGDVFRSYSITSLPKDLPNLDFLIELVDQGVASTFIKDLKVGNTVTFRGPLGVMTAKPDVSSYFFIATGVGIAPFKSIIASILNESPEKQITLLFGAGIAKRIFYHEDFEQYASQSPQFKYHPTITREEWQGMHGRVTEHLDMLYEGHQHDAFYLCGGVHAVTDVRNQLLALGHDPKHIKLEIFT